MNPGSYIIPCYLCNTIFKTELDMRVHAIKTHKKFVSECSTGLAERIQRQELHKLRRRKESMSTYTSRKSIRYGGNTCSNLIIGPFKIWLKYLDRGCKPYNNAKNRALGVI